MQLSPEHAQIPALHVQLPDVWHDSWQESPLHEQVLEPVHVRLHGSFGLLQLASQLSEPLHV